MVAASKCSYQSPAMIGPDNVTFLCELLDEIGRKDLTVVVKSYVEKNEGECLNFTMKCITKMWYGQNAVL